jgi:hypothetical protein
MDCVETSAHWFRGLDPEPVRAFLSLGIEAFFLNRKVVRANEAAGGLIEFSLSIIGGRELSEPHEEDPGEFLIKHLGHHVVICDEYGHTEER